MDKERNVLTGKKIEALDADELKTVTGGRLVIRRSDYPEHCFVITCPKCGSNQVMMQNLYKTYDGSNHWHIRNGQEEVDGVLDLQGSFVRAVLRSSFTCKACGYTANGFKKMNYTDDFWDKYQ